MLPSFAARPRISRRGVALCATLALLGGGACDQADPFRGVATSENVITGLGMAALSTGTTAPTALDFFLRTAVRPAVDGSGGANFQVAIDVDAQGRVLLIPVAALLNTPVAPPTVGLVRSSVAFDQLGRAPTSGFVTDSTVTAAVGETWVVQIQAGLCTFRDPLYGKLIVDGVNQQTGRLAVRFLFNANCGYRDLTVGVPRN